MLVFYYLVKNLQKFLPEAYIQCSHFSGIKGRDAITSRQFNGSLPEQFDAVYNFILSQLNKSFKIEGKFRQVVYEVPPVAIREALMNAILHRNYHLNSSIKIVIYNDRIEFFSPGNFPGPINLNDLQSGISYQRN